MSVLLAASKTPFNAVPPVQTGDHILQKVEELIDWLTDGKVGRLYAAVLVVALVPRADEKAFPV
ncbi:MAG: hypothetical protein EOQ86_18100 [Mesorhizobium sp.]|uniref:hypothetical protein n=1 Tax=Mesorhizobium sp. TaxID=1871066 RepID=UPI000FE78EC5|nr:hypothetical protein [Mesorhizobium sp.]RWH78552.1 MAG: hypothetical protein EOQ85_16450 [Mesorhizobium sp.]RWH80953.1 MAG: hypothetical protein EOQ86_18100 [Mesorhizobium sp.]RWH90550.1 MAG: hypothetical protein EOQ87_13600 [Mesorhizobium sp.]RWH97414.1 MAG: hypothetical protein EOQ88_17545 [Mesorhizobium sp.]RWI00987.1 MAG: hypothetical protein EOQ89_17560 [Mesorhizobium sp.]